MQTSAIRASVDLSRCACNFIYKRSCIWSLYIYMLSTFLDFGMCLIDNEEESMTSKLENMIGWKSLMSKVGIITLVSASLRSFCPISSLITSCSLTPSYFGNSRVFPSLLRKKFGSHVHVKRYRSVAIRGSIILWLLFERMTLIWLWKNQYFLFYKLKKNYASIFMRIYIVEIMPVVLIKPDPFNQLTYIS